MSSTPSKPKPHSAPPEKPREYHVEEISCPWLGGDGFLCGVPCAKVVLRTRMTGKSVPMTADRVVTKVQDLLRAVGPEGSIRWVAFLGDAPSADERIMLAVRTHLGMQTYAEAEGDKPNNDVDGFPAPHDHVAVRMTRPLERISPGILFHSVVVNASWGAPAIGAISSWIDKECPKVARFVAPLRGKVTVQDAAAVIAFGRSWRLTIPVAPDLDPAEVAREVGIRRNRDPWLAKVRAKPGAFK